MSGSHAPATKRRPSWSWTNVSAPILYKRLMSKSQLPQEEYTLRWKTHGVKSTLVDDRAPFGAVREAVLRLEAPIQRLYPCELEISAPWGTEWRLRTGQASSNGADLGEHICLKSDISELQIPKEVPIYLAVGYRAPGDMFAGLVVRELEECSESGVTRHERIGMFYARTWLFKDDDHTRMDAWFNGSEKRIIEIV